MFRHLKYLERVLLHIPGQVHAYSVIPAPPVIDHSMNLKGGNTTLWIERSGLNHVQAANARHQTPPDVLFHFPSPLAPFLPQLRIAELNHEPPHPAFNTQSL